MTAIKRDLLRVTAERKKISVLSRLRLSMFDMSVRNTEIADIETEWYVPLSVGTPAIREAMQLNDSSELSINVRVDRKE